MSSLGLNRNWQSGWSLRYRWRKRLADAFIGCCWALAVVGWIVVIPLAVYRIGGAG